MPKISVLYIEQLERIILKLVKHQQLTAPEDETLKRIIMEGV